MVGGLRRTDGTIVSMTLVCLAVLALVIGCGGGGDREGSATLEDYGTLECRGKYGACAGVDDGGPTSDPPSSKSSGPQGRPLTAAETRWLEDAEITVWLGRMLHDIDVFMRGGSLRDDGFGIARDCRLRLAAGGRAPTARLVGIHELASEACDLLARASRSSDQNRARAARDVRRAKPSVIRARELLDALGGR